jgi:hypothetical protein
MHCSLNDYYVFTSRRGDNPERWSWEIRLKSKPLGVKLTADGFQSDEAAQCREESFGKFSERSVQGRTAHPKVDRAIVPNPPLPPPERIATLESLTSDMQAWLIACRATCQCGLF